jgi:hypothetical protein
VMPERYPPRHQKPLVPLSRSRVIHALCTKCSAAMPLTQSSRRNSVGESVYAQRATSKKTPGGKKLVSAACWSVRVRDIPNGVATGAARYQPHRNPVFAAARYILNSENQI